MLALRSWTPLTRVFWVNLVIGGAVALNNPILVVDRIRERLPDAVVTDVPDITTSGLGEEAVLRGALVVAIEGGVDRR